jgi:hypothetical protein
MHGYELYQQIQAEGIDRWFNISAAGVYYSLRKLRDQGLVTESRQRAGGSSHKSVYRLTEEGRSAFFPAMEAELAKEELAFLDYDLVIYLLNRLPLQRAIPPLERRQAYLIQQTRAVESSLVTERDNGSSPLQLAILDHRRRFLEMERDWLAGVIRTIQEEAQADSADDGARRGLMILSGNLRDLHMPDLIRLIVSGQHSGTLTITDGAETYSLSFEGGQPVRASYLRRGERPASPLTCDQVLEGMCELFRWQEGGFAFNQRLEPSDWCVPLECSAEELILRGCRKVDTWDIIQRLVPSADTIFELGSAYERLEHLPLIAEEQRVAAAVDGIKNVTTIARDVDLTLFETSRVLYCLAAIGLLRTADLDKIRLRRVFREIAELMCTSALAWRPSRDGRTCEEEVNQRCAHLPLSLNKGRIEDRGAPQLQIEELREMYHQFLKEQFNVVSRRFGGNNARQCYEQTLRQLAPELQEVAKRHGFDRLAPN